MLSIFGKSGAICHQFNTVYDSAIYNREKYQMSEEFRNKVKEMKNKILSMNLDELRSHALGCAELRKKWFEKKIGDRESVCDRDFYLSI